MIDSMAAAVKAFEGGVVVISHDFRLLTQIAQEIWVVDHGIKKWDGDIQSYKEHLRKKMMAGKDAPAAPAAGGAGASTVKVKGKT